MKYLNQTFKKYNFKGIISLFFICFSIFSSGALTSSLNAKSLNKNPQYLTDNFVPGEFEIYQNDFLRSKLQIWMSKAFKNYFDIVVCVTQLPKGYKKGIFENADSKFKKIHDDIKLNVGKCYGVFEIIRIKFDDIQYDPFDKSEIFVSLEFLYGTNSASGLLKIQESNLKLTELYSKEILVTEEKLLNLGQKYLEFVKGLFNKFGRVDHFDKGDLSEELKQKRIYYYNLFKNYDTSIKSIIQELQIKLGIKILNLESFFSKNIFENKNEKLREWFKITEIMNYRFRNLINYNIINFIYDFQNFLEKFTKMFSSYSSYTLIKNQQFYLCNLGNFESMFNDDNEEVFEELNERYPAVIDSLFNYCALVTEDFKFISNLSEINRLKLKEDYNNFFAFKINISQLKETLRSIAKELYPSREVNFGFLDTIHKYKKAFRTLLAYNLNKSVLPIIKAGHRKTYPIDFAGVNCYKEDTYKDHKSATALIPYCEETKATFKRIKENHVKPKTEDEELYYNEEIINKIEIFFTKTMFEDINKYKSQLENLLFEINSETN